MKGSLARRQNKIRRFSFLLLGVYSEIIKVHSERPLTSLLLTAAFLAFQIAALRGAEPVVELSPSDVNSAPVAGETGVFSLPKVPLIFTFNTLEGYDNNVSTSRSEQSSWFTTNGLSLAYRSPGQRSHFDLLAGVSFTYYFDEISGQQNDVDAHLSSGWIYHVSTRLRLDAAVYAAYRTQPDFGSNVGVDTRQGNYFNTHDNISVSYDWSSRFSTVTSGTFQAIQYEDSSVESLNRIEGTFGQQLRFNLLHKGNTLVGEYRFQVIDYQSSPRDSMTHYALGGIDEEFNPQLSATIRGGATFRNYANFGNETDPRMESSLTYVGAHNATLSWNTSYGVEEPSEATAILSRTTFRTGLALKYDFTGRISSTVAGYYHHDDNKGANSVSEFTEDSFDISVGASYVINHHFNFNLGFQYSEISSGQASRDYTRERYSAGLSFTF